MHVDDHTTESASAAPKPPRLAPAYPLETERLLLRAFREDDLDALHAIHSSPEVARYLYRGPRSYEETNEALARKIAGATIHSEGDWLSVAATLRDGGAAAFGTGRCHRATTGTSTSGCPRTSST